MRLVQLLPHQCSINDPFRSIIFNKSDISMRHEPFHRQYLQRFAVPYPDIGKIQISAWWSILIADTDVGALHLEKASGNCWKQSHYYISPIREMASYLYHLPTQGGHTSKRSETTSVKPLNGSWLINFQDAIWCKRITTTISFCCIFYSNNTFITIPRMGSSADRSGIFRAEIYMSYNIRAFR